MNRKLLWAVLAIGLVLVIAPFALGLPGKAAAGERMMNGFQPIMQPTQVNTTAAKRRHLQPGPGGAQALPAACRDDAGERG